MTLGTQANHVLCRGLSTYRPIDDVMPLNINASIFSTNPASMLISGIDCGVNEPFACARLLAARSRFAVPFDGLADAGILEWDIVIFERLRLELILVSARLRLQHPPIRRLVARFLSLENDYLNATNLAGHVIAFGAGLQPQCAQLVRILFVCHLLHSTHRLDRVYFGFYFGEKS